MENFYPDPSFPRFPPQDAYNFRRHDGIDYYNLHVIPTNTPPMHVPYYPPPVQPELPFHQQQTSPTNSRTVTYKNNRNKSSRYGSRSNQGRSNLIQVRSTAQPPVKVKSNEVKSTTQSPVKVRSNEAKSTTQPPVEVWLDEIRSSAQPPSKVKSTEPKPIAKPLVNAPDTDSSSSRNITENKVVELESKSPYKSHSYSNERYLSLGADTKPASSYLEHKSSRSFSKPRALKNSKPSDRERDYYDKYHYPARPHRNNDYKWRKKDWEPKKHAQSKKLINEKEKNYRKKKSGPENDQLDDVSDTALDDDFEEVEVVSGVDLEAKELPLGFRKCRVRYLSSKKISFYKPRIYCISPERTIVNYCDYDEQEWNDNGELVTEEVYEMETEDVLSEEKEEVKSVKNEECKNEERGQEPHFSSKSDAEKNIPETDLKEQDIDDELVTSSRSYRICIPDHPEFFQGEAIIQPDIDAWKSHLIGLSYIIEIRDKSDDTNILQHRCVLCSDDIHAENDSGEMVIDHISSYKHMFRYLEKHFQTCGFKFTERVEENFNNKSILLRCCEEICNKLGYDCMCVTDDAYYEKNMDAVLKMIHEIPHRCEKDIKIDVLSYIKDVEGDISKTVLSGVSKDAPEMNAESVPDKKTKDKSDDDLKPSVPEKTITSPSKQKTNDKSDILKQNIPAKEITSPSKQVTNENSKIIPEKETGSSSNKQTNDESNNVLKAENLPENKAEPISKQKTGEKKDTVEKEVKSSLNDKGCNSLSKKSSDNTEKKLMEKSKASSQTKKKTGETAFSASKIAPFSLFSFGAPKKGKNSRRNKNKSKVDKTEVSKPQIEDDDDDGIEIIYESNPKPLNNQDKQDSVSGKGTPAKAPNVIEKKSKNKSVGESKITEVKAQMKDAKNENVPAVKESNKVSVPDKSVTQSTDKISEKQTSDQTLKEPEECAVSDKKSDSSPTKEISEGQKIPVLKEPVTPFKRKMMNTKGGQIKNKAVRPQTNVSNLKVLTEAEAVETMQPTITVPVQTPLKNVEITNNCDNNKFKVTEFSESEKVIKSELVSESKGNSTLPSAVEENSVTISTAETGNEDTNISETPFDDFTEEENSRQSDCFTAPDDSQASKSEGDKPASEHKSPKKKCCQHKHQHHHKTTVHSKYCIKRIISRVKISKEVAESTKDTEPSPSEDVAAEVKVSTFDDLKRKGMQKSADVTTSKNRSRASKSPEKKMARISPGGRSRSPTKRYKSPIRKYSPVLSYDKISDKSRSISPRRRSRSPIRRRSRSPIRRRSRSPIRRYSRSPLRRLNRGLPFRRKSRSPFRKLSRSPLRRQSRSPLRRQSRSPIRRKLRSPIRRSSRSPFKRQGRSPFRKRSISPFRKRSMSPFRKRSRTPLSKFSRSPLRKRSRSPNRRFSPGRRSPKRNQLRDRSRSLEREIQSIYDPEARNPQRKRSRSSSSSRKLPRSYSHPNRSNVASESYTRSSSKHFGHKSSSSAGVRGADLDPVSDEDESVYFNTSEKPQHIEEIMKLPEPTRSVISEMFKKFLSTSNVNPNDSSLLKFMQFMNSHSGEVQEIMSSPGPSAFNNNPFPPQKRNTIPHLGSGLRSQLPPNLLSNQQFQSPMVSNPLMTQNMLSQSIPPYVQPQIFPGAVSTTPHMLNQFQQNNLNAFPPNSNLPSNQHQFQQQNQAPPAQYVAPGLMIQNLKNTVHKLFGNNETVPQAKNVMPGSNLSNQFNSGQSNMVRQANIFPDPRSNASFQDNNSAIGRDRLFQRNEPVVKKDNVMNPVSQPSIPIPPPDARVSFCNAPSSASKTNLFPVVSSANTAPSFNSKNTQANVSDVKKSLAQRLAAVLIKVGMTDVPAPLLQEMLMKIGAFSSCPPQDITEAEIVNILRRLGYV